MRGLMPEKKRPLVITGLRVAGCFTILMGIVQIIDTFRLDTFAGVGIGVLIIAASAILFGLAAVVEHMHRQN